jgi:hypothetical protein
VVAGQKEIAIGLTVVWANTYNEFDPTSPFGGYKESGFGREGGVQGLAACNFYKRGMNTLVDQPRAVVGEKVKVTVDTLVVELSDGRTITAPLAWFPRMLHGTAKERNNWRFIGRGEGIHWPDLDEDISVEGLVLGKLSGESQQSFARWLEKRGRRAS